MSSDDRLSIRHLTQDLLPARAWEFESPRGHQAGRSAKKNRAMASERRVFVIDDDEAVRDSLGLLLESAGHQVRSFGSALDFLAAAPALLPGCVIVDVRMPDMGGLELQQRLVQQQARFPVIGITGHGDIAMAVRAMKAGAVDFVEKPFAEEAILAGVRGALERLEAAADLDGHAAAALARLTPRERDVLQGLVAGLPNKAIAYDLAISPRTVEIHRARVMAKMQARSFSELVRLE